jgi:hypothetical protein
MKLKEAIKYHKFLNKYSKNLDKSHAICRQEIDVDKTK